MCSIDAVSIHTPIQGVTLIASSSICSMLSFNPHTHTGCDARLSAFPFLRVCFNPHTHTGCDPFLLSWYVARKSFNPHTHTGCDARLPTRIGNTIPFQSTHPYRVWLFSSRSSAVTAVFQSTHPYRVWPKMLRQRDGLHTSFNPHTHTGCDLGYWSSCRYDWCFNPLTHTGCDRFLQYFIDRKSRFNPHTHTGCDQTPLLFGIAQKVSIHTPIQGVTCCDIISHLVYLRFNPHTHTGCDPASLAYCCQGNVSIHTPIQGVTERFSDAEAKVEFQSTHPYRVWRRTTSVLDAESGFNPHTHTGCDSILKPCYELLSCFNPHTHTGCDSTPCL